MGGKGSGRKKRIIEAFIPPPPTLKRMAISKMIEETERDIYLYFIEISERVNPFTLYSIIKSKHKDVTWIQFIRAFNRMKKRIKSI